MTIDISTAHPFGSGELKKKKIKLFSQMKTGTVILKFFLLQPQVRHFTT